MRRKVKIGFLIAACSMMMIGCTNTSKPTYDAKTANMVMQNLNARKAIASAIDKEAFVETILNNGSIAVDTFVPKNLAYDSELGDYRDFATGLGHNYNEEEAKKYWEEAKKELDIDNVTLKLVLTDTDFSKKLGEYIQAELGEFEGLHIELKQMPMEQRVEALANGDYNISFSGWGPDYPDPLTYLETFGLNNTYYKDTGYASKEYNDLLEKAKMSGTTKESWENYKKAEEILLNDTYLVPMYQRASAYLQKSYVVRPETSPFGPKYLYKDMDVTKDEKVLNLSNSADITTLDTTLVKDALSSDVISNVMEGLTRLDENSNAVPAIAKSWNVSEDKLTWTFDLRDDAVWTNGDKVTAHDFEYAVKRSLDPKSLCEITSIYYDIVGAKEFNSGDSTDRDSVGIKALDDYTLEIKLVRPVTYFDKLMSSTSFYPQNQKFVEANGEKYGTTVENSLFNGPYTLKTWKLEDQYSLAKNPTYWDNANVKLETVNVKIAKDSNADLNLYNNGDIDIVTVSSDLVDAHRDSKEFSTKLEAANNFLVLNAGNINE